MDSRRESEESLEAAKRAAASASKRLPGWREALDGFDPQPGSSLVGDGRYFSFDPVAHQVMSSLVFALDHLETFDALITRAQVVPTASGFTVLRGAIENVGRGLWLLGPSSRDMRLLRAAQIAYESSRDLLQLEMELSDEAGRPSPDHPRLKRIVASAARGGRIEVEKISSPAAMTRIMREAREFENQETDLPLVVVWRATSGLAHGRRDMMQALTEQEVVAEDGESVTIRVTSPLSTLVGIYYIAERQFGGLLNMMLTRGLSPWREPIRTWSSWPPAADLRIGSHESVRSTTVQE